MEITPGLLDSALRAGKSILTDELSKCLDPTRPTSRPSKSQWAVLNDIGKVQYRWVIAGNQCLASGTLVMTPTGPTPIEDIQVGDTVYDEHGKPIQVLKTFRNGRKRVSDLTLRGMKWATCTANHVFQVTDSHAKVRERETGKFVKGDLVHRVSVRAPLGNVSVPQAYALGALLGDGCSRQKGHEIQLSSGVAEVPEKVAAIVGNTARRLHESNYTWSVGRADIPYYDEWCKGRYAHEKIVDLDVVKTWDRESLLRFVAGIVDTDGSVYPAKDHVSLSVHMQAKSVIDALEYTFLALWQIPMSRGVDERAKYKNGPVHNLYTRNVHFVRQILDELGPHLVSPQKKWRLEYERLGGKRSNPDRLGLKFGANEREEETYDIHVDSPTNLYLLANGLVTHNSGKSAVAAREIAWILNGDHPSWTRPAEWGTGPLTIIVAGQDRKMMELELWGNKLLKFLNPADWREVRAGQSLQYAEHRKTGDRVVFISHADSSEKNRKHMQGYVAHYVWLDEMPASTRVLEELQRRVDSRNGYFLATFTPKFKNLEIRKVVDSATPPHAKKYQMSKFDNPIFAAHREREIAKLAGYSEDMRNAVLYGSWMSGDGLVHHFDPDLHGGAPENYDPSWRHVVVVDPATESKLGLTLWAEDPTPRDPLTMQPVAVCPELGSDDPQTRSTRMWWMVRADYVEGIYVPTEIIAAVEKSLVGLNVCLRRADSHEAWFIRQASAMPDGPSYTYEGIEGKNVPERKNGLIRTFQEGLGRRYRIADWCTKFHDEVQSYERDPETGKIKAKSKFHIIDTCHYFADKIPEPVHNYVYGSYHDRLYHAYLLEERRSAAREQARASGAKYVIEPAAPDIEAPLPPMPRARIQNRGWGRRKFRV